MQRQAVLAFRCCQTWHIPVNCRSSACRLHSADFTNVWYGKHDPFPDCLVLLDQSRSQFGTGSKPRLTKKIQSSGTWRMMRRYWISIAEYFVRWERIPQCCCVAVTLSERSITENHRCMTTVLNVTMTAAAAAARYTSSPTIILDSWPCRADFMESWSKMHIESAMRCTGRRHLNADVTEPSWTVNTQSSVRGFAKRGRHMYGLLNPVIELSLCQ